MAQVITFRGSNLWSDEAGGAGWNFAPGVRVAGAIEAKAPLGEGYWVKPTGRESTTHTLELQWSVANPATLRSSIESAAVASLGSLVVPVHGTFTNCRLSGVGTFDTTPSAGSMYLVKTTLTFTQYP